MWKTEPPKIVGKSVEKLLKRMEQLSRICKPFSNFRRQKLFLQTVILLEKYIIIFARYLGLRRDLLQVDPFARFEYIANRK